MGNTRVTNVIGVTISRIHYFTDISTHRRSSLFSLEEDRRFYLLVYGRIPKFHQNLGASTASARIFFPLHILYSAGRENTFASLYLQPIFCEILNDNCIPYTDKNIKKVGRKIKRLPVAPHQVTRGTRTGNRSRYTTQ